jgi:hypothetical protein
LVDQDYGGWARAWRGVEATLVAKGRYEFERVSQRRFRVHYSDPFLGVGEVFEIELKDVRGVNEQILRAEAAHKVMHSHISELEKDLTATRLLGGSLGSAVWSHERVLCGTTKDMEVTNIAFRLSFPSLVGVPIKELVSIRIAEADAFIAFRSALAKTMSELVAGGRVSDPDAAAAEIIHDLVNPELAKLRQRLRSAKRALTRKVGVSLALAGVGTICGSLGGVPPLAAGGVGFLLSGAGSAASKYSDEKQAIELSDMFFLWKALQHADKPR